MRSPFRIIFRIAAADLPTGPPLKAVSFRIAYVPRHVDEGRVTQIAIHLPKAVGARPREVLETAFAFLLGKRRHFPRRDIHRNGDGAAIADFLLVDKQPCAFTRVLARIVRWDFGASEDALDTIPPRDLWLPRKYRFSGRHA